MLQPINEDSFNLQPHQPQVIIQKDRANVDTAALLAAATKNGQELGEFQRLVTERQPKFLITFEHISSAAAVAGLVVFVLSAVTLDASINDLLFFYRGEFQAWSTAVFYGAGAAAVVFLGFLVLAVRQLNDTYHEDTRITYRNDERSGAAAVAVRQVFRLEVHEGNRIAYVDLPEWFTDSVLLQLAAHYHNGGGFSRNELEAAGICTQQEWPGLRDKFDSSGLAIKNGRSWELTDSFFALVDEIKKGGAV